MDQPDIEMSVLARYLSGTCTISEKKAVESWKQANSENQQSFMAYKRIWEASAIPLAGEKSTLDKKADWKKLTDNINQSTKRGEAVHKTPNVETLGNPNLRWLLRAAVVLLVAVLTGFFVYENVKTGNKAPSLRTITTNMGQRVHLTLSDGTTVLLNADSKIKMPAVFDENIREVYLRGEAYFHVAKNPARPFIVHSDGTVTRVLGTKFSVRAYPEDHEVTVAVKEGRVSFRPDKESDSRKSILHPRELALYNLQSQKLDTSEIRDMSLYLGWVQGYLKFRDTPMSKVAQALERQYGISVSFADEKIKNMRLTAFLKSRSLPNVLDVIGMSLRIKYKIKNDRVILMKH